MSPIKLRKPTPREEATSLDTTAERLRELAADTKLARLVATNPGAPADLLLELSRSDDKAVRKACTTNANTPVEALLKLGAQFPEQLLENQVFDLLLLDHPGLFEELPTSTLNSLLKRDQVPAALIRWAWKHRGENTLQSLLMNPNTPTDVVAKLCKSKDPEVRMAAELHCGRKLPPWAQDLRDDADLVRHRLFVDILRIDSTRKWVGICNQLSDCGDESINLGCLAVAPAETQRQRVVLSKAKGGAGERIATHRAMQEPRPSSVSGNPLSDNQIKSLLAIENYEARRAAARDPETHVEILWALAHRSDWPTREGLASNPHAPVDVLVKLSEDKDWRVRSQVAMNPQTPPEALVQLADDSESCIRLAVASNRKTPSATLINLSRDIERGVRWAAIKNKECPAHHALRVRDWLIRGLCEEGCSGSIPSPGRRFLFTLPQCPASILAKHFRSCSWLERFAIAGNPSTPESVLERMAREGNQLVRRAAAENLAGRVSSNNQQPSQDPPSP